MNYILHGQTYPQKSAVNIRHHQVQDFLLACLFILCHDLPFTNCRQCFELCRNYLVLLIADLPISHCNLQAKSDYIKMA